MIEAKESKVVQNTRAAKRNETSTPHSIFVVSPIDGPYAAVGQTTLGAAPYHARHLLGCRRLT